MNASIAIQTLPFLEGNRKEEMYSVIDEVIAYIKKQELVYEVGPFETTIEGELSQLIKIIEDVTRLCVEKGAKSVLSYVKIHYSEEGVSAISEKVEKHR
ncbi:thiamine-binding protein [Haloplasma contractile]|uniref:Thiamine-binding protein domain-containing protein n=1 Tax=Haloplasma contractile SSD-17B TaxID=1033810 RepID=U2FJR2_9MOLU|nr:thiamine-binding protein [Haloplasma contractile]ERJ13050.1 protein of unknown function DUF77 protein [Haloplasma contractile SSD-17B]